MKALLPLALPRLRRVKAVHACSVEICRDCKEKKGSFLCVETQITFVRWEKAGQPANYFERPPTNRVHLIQKAPV